MRELRVPVLTVLFIFLALFLFTKLFGPIPFTINSIQTTKSDLFRVTGEGEATAVPDTTLISLGVTKSANTVQEAQRQANETANKIINDLKALGVEEKDIKTTNYSVNPDYDYGITPLRDRPNVRGYTVTQNLEVKIKPIDRANDAIDKATSDGANLVGGIQFVLDDEVRLQLEEKARKDAVQKAKQKAQSLSSVSGIRLGKIVDVAENANQYPVPYARLEAAQLEGKGGDQTTITPGENTVKVFVTLSYETY